ncbi:MAG: hypothetical protein V1873_03560 [Verrucomicrobiota bacterium]
MKRILYLLVLAAVVGAAAGCSTPASRIREKADLFATLAPDVQSRLRHGTVEVGDTRDMAYIALGHPDRMYTRTTATGKSEVWAYVDYYSTTERQQVTGDFPVRDPNGGFRTVHDTVWVDVQQQHEYEKLRVEFAGDTVAAIEQAQR